jgi:hypothetical protein
MAIDLEESIRVATLDLLFSKGTETELASKFAMLVKNVSKEMANLRGYKKNETDLFRHKEDIEEPKLLTK